MQVPSEMMTALAARSPAGLDEFFPNAVPVSTCDIFKQRALRVSVIQTRMVRRKRVPEVPEEDRSFSLLVGASFPVTAKSPQLMFSILKRSAVSSPSICATILISF